jgi:hypothetical protein
MYPNDLALKKKSSFKAFLLVAIVPGILLGLCGSLVESGTKEPFKLMFDVWGVCNSRAIQQILEGAVVRYH